MHAGDIFLDAVTHKILKLGAIRNNFTAALGRDVNLPGSKLVKIKLGWHALKCQVCSGSNPLAPLSASTSTH